MSAPDPKTLAQRMVHLRLVTPAQLEECRHELGGGYGKEADDLLLLMERKGYLTTLQTDKLRRGDTIGYFLGNYRVLYKIASGSFGRVYRADEPGTGRVVAIKVLRQRWSDKPEAVELFEREGRVGMSLRHQNIVEILQVGKEPAMNQFYIVMEFVEGGNLRDMLAIRKRFTVAETLKLMEDVTSAMAYAYSRGVTHRDLKLTNILISSQNVAKVVDFGLAQIFSSKYIMDDDDVQVQRTVDYAGLEKATGAPNGDVRSDVYFLGCIAYEMLSGRPPLQPTRNKLERMRRERFMSVKPLRPDEIDGPPAVLRLLENMMAIDPEKRYQTPTQLLDAIRTLRRETGSAEGQNGVPVKVAPTIFVLESDTVLQDRLRDKLKKEGYRVLLASDPTRAVDRFQQNPYSVLIVDAETVGDDGVRAMNTILLRSRAISFRCHGMVIVADDHQRITKLLEPDQKVTILNRPLKLGDLMRKLHEVEPPPQQAEAGR
jgi:serine/threonine protein kinase